MAFIKQPKRGSSNLDNFMTEKEKNYVSFIFQKSILKTEKIYHYSKFFDHELIQANDNKMEGTKEYQIAVNNNSKREIIKEFDELRLGELKKGVKVKESFEKSFEESDKARDALKQPKQAKVQKISFIKSIKLPRLMIDVDIPVLDDLAIKLKIEEMIDAFTCKRYKIKESNLDDLLKQSGKRIHEFFKVVKFQKLVKEIFEDEDETTKKILLLEMIKQSRFIKITEGISMLLDYLVLFVPKLTIDEIYITGFFDNFMFSLSGVLFATLLLINQEQLAPHFFKNLQSRMEYLVDNDLKYVWRFLALLLINLGDGEKRWMIRRLRDKILEVATSNNESDINDMSLFLDALGLDSQDIS